jgi:hypothetical protein
MTELKRDLNQCDTILNFTENSVKMTKTDYDPDRPLVLIEGESTNYTYSAET